MATHSYLNPSSIEKTLSYAFYIHQLYTSSNNDGTVIIISIKRINISDGSR